MKKRDKINLIPFSEIHNDLMKKEGFRNAYNDLNLEFDILEAVIKARVNRGLTQRDLAEKIGVPQSSLARFEAGRINPTLSFLKKVVSGLGLKIAVI